MRKYFSLLALAAVAALGFTSCNDDDDAPQLVPVTTSDGVFVVCGGNLGSKIDGSLTYYDYNTGIASQEVYKAANGVSLGITVTDVVVYGSKIYILGDGEKTIFVADKNTLKKVKNITAEVNGEPATPRHAVADGGYVYVSTYSNAVLAIDTVSTAIEKTFTSGDYSDGIAVDNGYLYTADSDYGRYGKEDHGTPSISKINIATGETQIITHELIKNPQGIAVVNGRIFFQDSGFYDANWNQLEVGLFELLADGNVKKIAPATDMAVSDNKIYIINAPYSYPATTPSYSVVDIATGVVSQFCDGTEIGYPSSISIDQAGGVVYITSYTLKENTSSANYKVPGYCVAYSTAGVYQYQFECGVGGGKVIPNTETQYIQK